MVKIKLENTAKIKLQKGNKIIERNYIDYENNKKVWDFKGYKPVENNVKEEKVVELKPKKRKTRKKKDESINNDES
jgi:hypothetical protein|tara:strand:- start:235 stop:462 length:228 start_codon:yes stop_codon:yes gene_type:complete